GVNSVKATWQPIKPKVGFESKAHGNLARNGAPNVSSPTTINGVPKVSNYAKVALSQEFDNVDSEEKVEIVYDESASLLKSTKKGASASTASDFHKT
ncbi:hypothetical protein Tco_1137078, partial [Tanacetum coccineum]